jgi:hypothetical protein
MACQTERSATNGYRDVHKLELAESLQEPSFRRKSETGFPNPQRTKLHLYNQFLLRFGASAAAASSRISSRRR